MKEIGYGILFTETKARRLGKTTTNLKVDRWPSTLRVNLEGSRDITRVKASSRNQV